MSEEASSSQISMRGVAGGSVQWFVYSGNIFIVLTFDSKSSYSMAAKMETECQKVWVQTLLTRQ